MALDRVQQYHDALTELCQSVEEEEVILQKLTVLFFREFKEVLRMIPIETPNSYRLDDIIRLRAMYLKVMNLMDYCNPAFLFDKAYLMQVAGLLYLWLDFYVTPEHGEKAEIDSPKQN